MAGKSITRGKQRAKALEKSRPEAPGAPPAPVLPDEPLEAKQARAARVLEVLEELYPNAATELEHRNPFELLVATVLSAQATDASVNKATPALFTRYPQVERSDVGAAPPAPPPPPASRGPRRRRSSPT